MIIHTMPQGTEEWYTARCGHVSASMFSAVMAKGQGKTRHSYMMKLLAERLSGIAQETYSNKAMEAGVETEPLAREYYESTNDLIVEQVGFIEVNEDLGCSPDGLIDIDGTLEIKCPLPSTHLQYILDDKFPTTYRAQVQGQLWVSEREWCDFVSFAPTIKARPMFTKRVHRDERYIDTLEVEVERFIVELKELEKKIATPF